MKYSEVPINISKYIDNISWSREKNVFILDLPGWWDQIFSKSLFQMIISDFNNFQVKLTFHRKMLSIIYHNLKMQWLWFFTTTDDCLLQK